MQVITTRILYGILFFVVAGVVFVFGMSFGTEKQKSVPVLLDEASEQPKYTYGLYGREFYEAAYKGVRVAETGRVQSALAAHHLLAARPIAEVFETLAKEQPTTIVIVSPNHFDVGRSPAQVSFGTWQTPYGDVSTNMELAEMLAQRVAVLEHEESAAPNEHGIGALTAFVKRSMPRARIVPLIVHESLTPQDAREIGEAVAALSPDAVMIASIDMSHNLPQNAAAFHDEVTLRQIESGGLDDVNLEIDSNATLRILQAFNAAHGTERFALTHHGSSLQMGAAQDWRDNTSHILGVFTYGEPSAEPFAALHIVGDVMLDRGVRRKMDEHGTAYPWQNVTRFLQGAHLRVGNLEGTVNEQPSTYTVNPPFRFVFVPKAVEAMKPYIDVVSLANNHSSDVGTAGLRETRERLDAIGMSWFGGYTEPTPRYDTTINGMALSLIGYHQFQPNIQALEREIAAADAEGRFVIVLPHWGAEYVTRPQPSQRALAERMADAGADLIVGGHPHVPQGIEVIGDVPVVYSLGNFVFDQEIPSTWNALTLGVTVERDRVILHLLPVGTRGGQPVPLSDESALALRALVADMSDENIHDDVAAGVLTIFYVQ